MTSELQIRFYTISLALNLIRYSYMFYRNATFFTEKNIKTGIQRTFEADFKSMETDKYEELGELDTIQLKFKHFDSMKN